LADQYDDRLSIYKENMTHITQLKNGLIQLNDGQLCNVTSNSLGSHGSESMGVYHIVHDKLKNIIYKKMESYKNTVNAEMDASVKLSKLVTDDIFPHFPIYYGHTFCKAPTEYSMRLYEKATGDGEKWATEYHDHANLTNKFISFLIQTAMMGLRLEYQNTWIDDFKPENYLYLKMPESPTKYFHYQYSTNDDNIINIYVGCTGELWLRSDYGYVSEAPNIYKRTVQSTWKMYDKFRGIEPEGPHYMLNYYHDLLQQLNSENATNESVKEMKRVHQNIKNIEDETDINDRKRKRYDNINKIRDTPQLKKIYETLIREIPINFINLLKDMPTPNPFGELLITNRPSEELILNKKAYQLNYDEPAN
jgi:hypothetical protein